MSEILYKGTVRVEENGEIKSKDFTINKPTRKDKAKFNAFYSIELSKAISAGFLTAELLERSLNTFANPIRLSDTDKLQALFSEMVIMNNSITQRKSNGEDVSKDEESLSRLTEEYEKIEKPYKELFSRTAEFQAQDKTVTMAVFELTRHNDIMIFKGSSFEEKLENFYELDEKSLDFHIFNKAYLALYSYMNGDASSLENPEDIQNFFDNILV